MIRPERTLVVTKGANGKPEAIRRTREMNPYNTVIMIGDGITDIEAVQETGGVDLFTGYGGVVERSYVKKHADWWVTHHDELTDAFLRFKVAVVGSGACVCSHSGGFIQCQMKTLV